MTDLTLATRSLLLFAALAARGAAPMTAEAALFYPMPKMLYLYQQTLPVWAEASVAVSAEGELNPAVWGSETARIHEILTTPADNPIYFNDKLVGYRDKPSAPGCRDVGPTFFDYPEPPRRGTLEEAVTDSKVALLGRVTNKAYGFYAGEPGQLFQLEPVRSYGSPLSKARYYFFMPIGRFSVAGLTICKTDQRYAEPPDIGGEVFLFVLDPEKPAGVLFHVLDPGDVVPINSDGSLRLPLQYTAGGQGAFPRVSTLRTKSDLLTTIQMLRGSPAPAARLAADP
jgi:hypothetical protein